MYGNQNAYDPRYAQQPYQGSSYPSSNHSNQSADYDYPVSSPMGGHAHTLSVSPGNFGVMGAGGDHLDSRGKRRRGNLPKPVTDVLRAWFHDHLDHPYPTEEDKQIFMSRTGLSISQVCSPFTTISVPLLVFLVLIAPICRSATGSSTPDDDNCPLSGISFGIVTVSRFHEAIHR